MRSELTEVVRSLFVSTANARDLTEEEADRLVTLATLVVRARSSVERDGHTREIELVPSPEAPTRLVIVLERLLAGLDSLGATRTEAWEVVTKAALDCVPALRLSALSILFTADELDTNEVAELARDPDDKR